MCMFLSSGVEGCGKIFPSFHPSLAWEISQAIDWYNHMLHHFSFISPWSISWVCEIDCPQERQARDPTCYTRTSSGTCTEKTIKSSLLWYHWSGLFSAQNESGDIIKKCTKILQIFNNIIEMCQRRNHKDIYTLIHDFY